MPPSTLNLISRYSQERTDDCGRNCGKKRKNG